MTAPDWFDSLYTEARDRLLLQAYALTGDLPASRSAVRDSFVQAWHHARKVSRLEDPEAWVRRQVWAHAQRRSTARLWHRDRSTDPGVAATLDALGELTSTQRRLLMGRVSPIPLAQLARDVGLPPEEAREEYESASARFALHRDIDRLEVREVLAHLGTALEEERWPRATILRRAGTRRRRGRTGIAAAVAAAAMVVAGFAASGDRGVELSLARDQLVGQAHAVRATSSEPVPRIMPRHLLSAAQVERLAPGARWRARSTSDNTQGEGIRLPCQGARFADPEATGSLVRVFRGRTPQQRPDVRAVQTAELSADAERAAEAHRTNRDWYASCPTPDDDVQLVSTHTIRGVGEAAHLFVLRSRTGPETTYAIGTARSGRLTTTVLRQQRGNGQVDTEAMTSLLAAAVNGFCGAGVGETCAGPPDQDRRAPLPASDAEGMLAAVDLPRMEVPRPWAGTGVEKARTNLAATTCDDTEFTGRGVRNGVTRTHLIPEAKLPDTFGLTQTRATMRHPGAARRFVQGVRDRLAGCEDEDSTTTVEQLAHRSSGRQDLTAWQVTTEVSEDRTMDFLMAIVRRRGEVAQLGFVGAPRADLSRAEFIALAERSQVRLGQPAVAGPEAD